jgi:hypothetical protein
MLNSRVFNLRTKMPGDLPVIAVDEGAAEVRAINAVAKGGPDGRA